MTTTTVNDPWSSLTSQQGEWVGRRALVGHPLDVFWMLHPDGSPALLVKHAPQSCIPQELPKLRGMGVVVRDEADKSASITLHLRVPEDRDVFLRLCEDVLWHSKDGNTWDDAARRLFHRLRRWQSLLGLARGDELSEEEMRGLYGELVFLRGPLSSQCGFLGALSAWVAPMRHPQDFVRGQIAFEVKARVAGSRNQVRISSLDQLEVKGSQLALVVVELLPVTEADGGQSLNDLVSSLLDEAEACGNHAIEQLQRALSDWGYVASRSYDRHKFLVGSISAYAVIEGFPRITRSACDERIIEASYIVGLQSLGSFSVELSTLMQNR